MLQFIISKIRLYRTYRRDKEFKILFDSTVIKVELYRKLKAATPPEARRVYGDQNIDSVDLNSLTIFQLNGIMLAPGFNERQITYLVEKEITLKNDAYKQDGFVEIKYERMGRTTFNYYSMRKEMSHKERFLNAYSEILFAYGFIDELAMKQLRWLAIRRAVNENANVLALRQIATGATFTDDAREMASIFNVGYHAKNISDAWRLVTLLIEAKKESPLFTIAGQRLLAEVIATGWTR